MARKMKDSGIEWIGEIPEGWEILAHKYIMHKEKSICEHYSGEDVISLTLNGVVKRDLENPSGKMPTTFDGYQFVDSNDLLLCLFDIDVTPRCVGLVKDYGVTSPAYSRFKIHSGFCNTYYNYLLRFIDDEKVFVHLSKNLRSSLTESDFGAIKTIVPPKAEQQRIADYLDNRTFEIDTLLSKARSSIEEYKKLKQTVITQAVTKGVRGEREMKDSGVAWIGEIPKEFNPVQLKFFCKLITDGTHFSPTTVENGWPYITAGDVHGIGLDYNSAKRISEEDFQLLVAQGCQPLKGDVLLVKDGATTGRVGFVDSDTPCVILSSVAMLRPADNADGHYLMYLLASDFLQKQILVSMAGSAMPRTTLTKLTKYIGLLPPLHEQKEIANYLDAKCAEIDKLIAKKEQLVKELESYKKSLIYEVVTGKREV